MGQCQVTYNGLSYPYLVGIQCDKEAGHDDGPPHGDARHVGFDKSQVPLMWYTEAQKAARAKEKHGPGYCETCSKEEGRPIYHTEV
jgi:hypothetical protein